VGGVKNIKIDACRVVHYVSVMFTGEDVTGSTHVGRELIDFAKAAVDHMLYEVRITKVADHKVIGLGFAEPWELEIGASHPKAFALEPLYKMVTDEATGPAYQRSFSAR
jgi:hypothetical protein